MNLAETITAVVSQLEKGLPPNEEGIKQSVVLRLLAALGWDVFDTRIVWPEFSVGQRRVDYALCAPPIKPAVFIEAKQPGRTDDADKQLFEYAFHEGVPLAILTDGQSWSFYLPGAQGSYEDRRVYRLDLLERTVQEAEEKFIRYLLFTRVASGAALDDTQADYRNRARGQQAKQMIPDAWKELVDAEDTLLVDMLIEATERRCGVKPLRNDVVEFLSGIRFGVLQTSTKRLQPQPSSPTSLPSPNEAPTRGSWYRIDGRTISVRSAKDVVLGILRDLEGLQPGFLERCSIHDDNLGRSRTYIARQPEQLYPDRPDLKDLNEPIVPGWFLMTNFSNQVKRRIIVLASLVSGIRLKEQTDFQL